MDSNTILLEIFKAFLPFLVSFGAAYVMMRLLIDNEKDRRDAELQLKMYDTAARNKQEIFPIRLQAYERVLLYLERMTPQNLLMRIRQDEMTAPELQFALVSSIRSEYEHNITQQLYVSVETWSLVHVGTEELIGTINTIGRQLPTDASGLDLSRAVLRFTLDPSNELTIGRAIEELKIEAQRMF